ncbi:importin subunit beta-3, partial [Lobosporangium transversale]
MSCPVQESVLQQLFKVLTNLVSSDNTIRASAETYLNADWILKKPDALLSGLAHFAKHSEVADLRSFAAVLTRRVAFKAPANQDARSSGTKSPSSPIPSSASSETTLWGNVQEDTRTYVKAQFLESLVFEIQKSVRIKICDTIAEIAHSFWPELLPALFECAKSSTPEVRESTYRIFASVPHLIASQDVEVLKNVFAASLKDENLQVRLAATKSAASFMLDTDHNTRNALMPLMPFVLDTLNSLMTVKDEAGLVEGLGVVIELAENSPRLFRHVLMTMVPFMLLIIKNKSFGDQPRQSALELLLTIAECAPNLIRKSAPDFTVTLVPVILEMMKELDDDDQEWYATDDQNEDDEEENYVLGEHAMDRLARALGSKAMLPVCFQYIPQLLGNQQDWTARHAGLMAVSSIAEGCARIMERELAKVLHMVVPFLKDSHPRVRYAACHAIGQMATDFKGTMQKNHHALVLTNLIPVMDDAPHPRVRAHAAAALVNFCEAAEKRILEPYLDAIFERLLSLLKTGTTYVQEQAITTIATVADSAEDRFVKYYNGIMPLLIDVLRQATTPEYRLLRGKAMECASLIALAVGKDVFGPHSQEFVKLLVQAQTSLTELDDPQASYLLAAWARICKVLGQDFVPYLDTVMPPLLTSAALKPDFAILDPEDDVASKYPAEDGWEFVTVDGRQLGIKTTMMEEKCTALEMLNCYARELGSGFRPYIERVRDIALPLLRFYFHEGVRRASAAILPQLISCAKQSELGEDYLHNMWSGICLRMIDTMSTETDATYLHHLYNAFHEALDFMGPSPSLSLEMMEAFTKATKRQLKELYARLKDREEARAAAGLEVEERVAIEEEEFNEESVLNEISGALQSVLKYHGVAYMASFRMLTSVMNRYLGSSNLIARQWSLRVLNDFVEFTGQHSWPVMVSFLPQMLESVVFADSAEIRQVACYGIGLCGQYGGSQYAEVCAAALSLLFQVIYEPGSRDPENILATEKAIAAVAKICKFNHSQFDVNAVLPSWIQTLPILHDERDASMTYCYMLDLIEAQNMALLGLNNVNLPHITAVMIEALAAGIVPEPMIARMMQTFKAALSMLDSNTTTVIWSKIAPEKKKTLQE